MKIPLNSKAYWHVAANTDMEKLFPGRYMMIKAMKDLLPIIKPYVKQNDLKKYIKSKRLDLLFKEFMDLVSVSLRSPVTAYAIKHENQLQNAQYYIDIYCYHDLKSSTAYYMPVEFLPHLKKRNLKLFNIIVEAIRILVNVKNVNCLEEEHWNEYSRERLEERLLNTDLEQNTEEEIAVMEQQLIEYDKYIEPYYKLLNKPGCSMGKLVKMFNEYTAETSQLLDAEKTLIEWTRKVIRACEEPFDMNFFSIEALNQFGKLNECEKDEDGNYEFMGGQPVTPDMRMMFVWYNDDDIVQNTLEYLGELGGNFGEADYSKTYSCKNANQLRIARKDFTKDVGKFPELLGDLLEYGMVNADLIEAYSKGKLIGNVE